MAAKPHPETQDPLFQAHAQATDAGVTTMLARMLEHGADPKATASGALMAVLRFHVQLFMPVSQRVLLELIIPSITKAAETLLPAPANGAARRDH